MIDKMYEDSLDAFPKKNVDQEKARLRTAFKKSLQKLRYSDTCERALVQIQRLLKLHLEPYHLTVFLSCIKELRLSDQTLAKENQVITIAFITQHFKSKLIDPSESCPSLRSTVSRVLHLLLRYFSDLKSSVQQACARAVIDLQRFCFSGQDEMLQKETLFDPLCQVVLNKDKASQSTAALCLHQLICYYKKDSPAMLKNFSAQLGSLLSRTGAEYYWITEAVSILVEADLLQQIKLPTVLKSLSHLLKCEEQKALQQFNGYMARIAACRLIERIAIRIQAIPTESKAEAGNIFLHLKRLSHNRIVQLQKAALNSLKLWSSLLSEDEIADLEQVRFKEPADKPNQRRNASLEERRKQKRISNSKEREEKLKQLEVMHENLDQLIKGKGWGAHSRGKNFVRKGTGSGGGNVMDTFSEEVKAKNLSFISQSKQLKEMIQQDKAHSPKHAKFELLDEKEFQIGEQKGDQAMIPRRRVPKRQVKHDKKHVEKEEEKEDKPLDIKEVYGQLKYMLGDDEKEAEKNERGQLLRKRQFYNYLKQQMITSQSQLDNLLSSQDTLAHLKHILNSKPLQTTKQQNQHQSKQVSSLPVETFTEGLEKIIEVGKEDMEGFKLQEVKGDQAAATPMAMVGHGMIPLQAKELQQYLNQNKLSLISSDVQGLGLQDIDQQVSFNSGMNQELFKMAHQSQPRSTIKQQPAVTQKDNHMLPPHQFKPAKQQPASQKDNRLPPPQQFKPAIKQQATFIHQNKQLSSSQEQVEHPHAKKEEIKNDKKMKIQQSQQPPSINHQANVQKMPDRKNSRRTESDLAYSQSQSFQPPSQTPKESKIMSPQSRFDNIREYQSDGSQVEEEIVESIEMQTTELKKQKEAKLNSQPKQSAKMTNELLTIPATFQDEDGVKQMVRQEVGQILNGLKEDLWQVKDLVAQLSKQKLQQARHDQQQLNDKEFMPTGMPQLKDPPPIRIQDPHLQPVRIPEKRQLPFKPQPKQPISRSVPLSTSKPKWSVDQTWRQAMSLSKQGKMNQAYNLILESGDQIYLLRLLFIYGPPARHLTPSTVRRFTTAFMKIYQSNFFSVMTISFLNEVLEMGPSMVEESLTVEQIHQLLSTLYDLSASQDRGISFRAACLYNSLQQRVSQK